MHLAGGRYGKLDGLVDVAGEVAGVGEHEPGVEVGFDVEEESPPGPAPPGDGRVDAVDGSGGVFGGRGGEKH